MRQEIYALDDDLKYIDLVTLAPFSDLRRRLSAWESKAIDGHRFEIWSPAIVDCPLALNDAKAPVVCIVEKLLAIGWTKHTGKIIHSNSRVGNFDARNILSQRSYLQCILDIKKVLKLSGGTLPSDQTNICLTC